MITNKQILGQEFLLNKINFYLESYKTTGYFPHSLLLSPKGTGKSLLARAIAEQLHFIDKKRGIKKVFIELNCADIKNIDQLFSNVFIPHCQDGAATMFFDESSELPKKVAMFLLSVLQPNKENRNIVTYGGMSFTFDFTKHTFLFATSEAQKIFEALKDRLEQLQLSQYSTHELGKIIQKNLKPEYRIDSAIIDDLATYSRMNPRSAFMLTNSGINPYLASKGKKVFEKEDVKELITILDIFENGLSRYEAQLLKVIGSRDASSLNMLCAKTGLTRQSMQKMEYELLKYGLIEIKGQRRITARGSDYLKENKERLTS